jgi:hypothetical protein
MLSTSWRPLMQSAMIVSLMIGIASEARAMLVIPMPEPGTIPTAAIYLAGLGLFMWYLRRRSKRSQ